MEERDIEITDELVTRTNALLKELGKDKEYVAEESGSAHMLNILTRDENCIKCLEGWAVQKDDGTYEVSSGTAPAYDADVVTVSGNDDDARDAILSGMRPLIEALPKVTKKK